MQKKKIIIIGSGIAGLARSIRLALQGFDVSVYEKNNYAGGKLGLVEMNGYHFDSGPSLFTQPSAIVELFEIAGEDIKSFFSYHSVPVSCRYFFSDGKRITAFADSSLFANEMQEKLGEPASGIKKYLSGSKTLYEKIAGIFLNYSLHKRATWLHNRVLKALWAVKLPWLASSLNGYNNRKFKTANARQLFNRYATYNGSNPYQAPAMLSVIPHLEFNEGTWYPVGGMRSIADALYQLALRQGVMFHFNSPVDRIICTDGRASGVVLQENNIFCDGVVSNCDVYFTYKNLLKNRAAAENLLKQERSSSAVIFYWAIKMEFKSLGLHNILFSADYQREFKEIFMEGKAPSSPTIYINITSKEQPEHAPDGCENWFVMINVAPDKGQDWDTIVDVARQNIINRVNKEFDVDLKSLIHSETVKTPVDLERETGSYMGSLYGTSSNSSMAAFFRHPNFSKDIDCLYFCGGSVHPGGGIPLCLQSAKITAGLISEDKSLMSHHE